MVIFIRYNKGAGNSALMCRVRDNLGRFWNFNTLTLDTVESVNTSYTMTEFADSDPYESTYSRDITLPYPIDVPAGAVEVYKASTGEVLGQESLATYRMQEALGKLTFSQAGQLEVAVDTASIVTIPSLNGAMYSPTVQYGQTLKVVQGDSPTITGILNNNYTGYTVTLYFEQKDSKSPQFKFNQAGTWLDVLTGSYACTLSSLNTQIPGTYEVDVKVVKDGITLTGLKTKMVVIEGAQ